MGLQEDCIASHDDCVKMVVNLLFNNCVQFIVAIQGNTASALGMLPTGINMDHL